METATRVRVLPAPPYEPPGAPVSAQAEDLLTPPPTSMPRSAGPVAPVAVPISTVAARRFAIGGVKLVFEVIDRRRAAGHLATLVSPAVLDHVGALVRADVARSRSDAPAVARMCRLHVQMQGEDAAEVFGTYERGRRVRAFAARIEHRPCRTRESTGRYQFGPVRIEHRWQMVAFSLA